MRVLLGVRLAVVVLFGSVAVWQAAEVGAKSPEAEGLSVGQRPPPFAATDLRGQRQSLKQYRGQVVVLHFWATWCPYCRGEIPKLLEVYRHGETQDVTVLAVSVDRDVEQLAAFVTQATLPYIVIPDARSDTSLADLYGVQGIPVTYVLDRDGRIAYRFFGSADLIGAVQRLMAKSPAPEA